MIAAWATAVPPAQQLAMPFRGGYYVPVAHDATGLGVLASLGVNAFRAVPMYVPAGSDPITAISAETTVIGDIGSSLRIAIYDDNNGANPALPYTYPTALLADVGSLPTDGIGQPTATLASPLQKAGQIVWVGGALQNISILQPTLRITSRVQQILPSVVCMANPNTVPSAGATACGYQMNAFSGAPPATFTTTLNNHSAAPRFMVKFG